MPITCKCLSTCLHLPFVFPLQQGLIYNYGQARQDPSTLQSTIATHRAYAGIHPPIIQQKNGWLPDWSSRFFLEDIPHGLVVLRGIADIVGVSIPLLDTILNWAQTQMGRTYLTHGQLTGKDISDSGAPSCYHISNIKDLIP